MIPGPLITVDVGNNRTKCGLFRNLCVEPLPEPDATIALDNVSDAIERVTPLLASVGNALASWWIGSVNRPAATRLLDWIRNQRPNDEVRLVTSGDLPLCVAIPRPDMVGIDRLLDAVAVNRLRSASRAAVVVDVGTAISVDFVSVDGVFRGGAILPGIAMSARALHTFTDLLPLIAVSELSVPPPAIGNSTEAAMRSGLFWGSVGAIRQLIEEMSIGHEDRLEVFLTGGAGPAVAGLIAPDAQHVPHLTLSGIAIAAQHAAKTETH